MGDPNFDDLIKVDGNGNELNDGLSNSPYNSIITRSSKMNDDENIPF